MKKTYLLAQLHNCTGTKWPGHRPCTCHQLPQVQGGETDRILPDDIYTDTILTDRQNMKRQNAKGGNMNGQNNSPSGEAWKRQPYLCPNCHKTVK